jgi:hypothetical protein
MDGLTAKRLLTTQPFDTRIKWPYCELRHHEGRRERHGASMAGPDYTWWHGLYEVAKVFYTDSVPQARALDAKVVDDALGGMTEHNWLTNGPSEKQIRQILDFYKERYAQWPEAAVGDCQSVLRGAPCGVPIRSRVRGRPDRQHGHYRACLSPTSAARD